jgi:hypothetical protein
VKQKDAKDQLCVNFLTILDISGHDAHPTHTVLDSKEFIGVSVAKNMMSGNVNVPNWVVPITKNAKI